MGSNKKKLLVLPQIYGNVIILLSKRISIILSKIYIKDCDAYDFYFKVPYTF